MANYYYRIGPGRPWRGIPRHDLLTYMGYPDSRKLNKWITAKVHLLEGGCIVQVNNREFKKVEGEEISYG